MAYVSLPVPVRPPARRRLAGAATRTPFAVPPQGPAAARRGAVTRVRFGNGGTELGVLPAVVLAAVPSVKQLAQKAITSVIGIVDPGKKRDANRKARAQMWCDLANAGSITAARRVLGGSRVQYTALERGYYQACWNALLAKEPRLTTAALAAGPLPVPEPGSEVEPPFISDEDMQSLQREIDAYRNPGTTLTPNAPDGVTAVRLTNAPAQAGGNVVVGLGLVGALLVMQQGGRGRRR